MADQGAETRRALAVMAALASAGVGLALAVVFGAHVLAGFGLVAGVPGRLTVEKCQEWQFHGDTGQAGGGDVEHHCWGTFRPDGGGEPRSDVELKGRRGEGYLAPPPGSSCAAPSPAAPASSSGGSGDPGDEPSESPSGGPTVSASGSPAGAASAPASPAPRRPWCWGDNGPRDVRARLIGGTAWATGDGLVVHAGLALAGIAGLTAAPVLFGRLTGRRGARWVRAAQWAAAVAAVVAVVLLLDAMVIAE